MTMDMGGTPPAGSNLPVPAQAPAAPALPNAELDRIANAWALATANLSEEEKKEVYARAARKK